MARPKTITDEHIYEATLASIRYQTTAFSTAVVAEKLCVSPQAILKRMNTKEELLCRSVGYFVERELANGLVLSFSGADFDRHLKAQAARLVQFFGDIGKFRSQFEMNQFPPSAVCKYLKQPPPVVVIEGLQKVFDQAQQAGVTSAAVGTSSAEIFIGALAHQLMLRQWFGTTSDWGELSEFIDDLVLTFTPEKDAGTQALPKEIERKFLLSGEPSLPADSVSSPMFITQGYLPGKSITERLRRAQTGDSVSYWRTIKIGRGLERVELEDEIQQGLFDQLWPATEGKRLSKVRWKVAADAHVWEIDSFTDRALVLAEVEMKSVDEKVAIPTWLAQHIVRDVTDEAEFTNWALAGPHGVSTK